jgi:hypothetical protein
MLYIPLIGLIFYLAIQNRRDIYIFTNPHPPPRQNAIITTLSYTPFACYILSVSKLFLNYEKLMRTAMTVVPSVILITSAEELGINGVVLAKFGRGAKGCAIATFLYGLHGYVLTGNLTTALCYSAIGFTRVLSSRVHSLFENTIYSTVFNIYALLI